MMIRNGTFPNGNDKFHGFLKDLLDRLKNDLDFEYVLHEVSDKTYGVRQKDGTWNGLIGELIDKVLQLGLSGCLGRSHTVNIFRLLKSNVKWVGY